MTDAQQTTMEDLVRAQAVATATFGLNILPSLKEALNKALQGSKDAQRRAQIKTAIDATQALEVTLKDLLAS